MAATEQVSGSGRFLSVRQPAHDGDRGRLAGEYDGGVYELFETTRRCSMAEVVSIADELGQGSRAMEVLSEHLLPGMACC
jgi:hypothetical protein